MLYYLKKSKNTTEMQKKICVVYGEGAVTDWMCQKWFVKFCVGDFSLEDALWLDRLVEVDSDQFETLTENNEYHTMWEIADIPKVSKSIKLLVKMKTMSFILKPYRPFGQPNTYSYNMLYFYTFTRYFDRHTLIV